MSIPRSGGLNGRAIYTNISKPYNVDLNFVIDAANPNGAGCRSLKSNGYVHGVQCYATPAALGLNVRFASGTTVMTVVSGSMSGLQVGMDVADTTTGGNISGSTTIASFDTVAKTITLSAVTAGASAVSPSYDAITCTANALSVGITRGIPLAGYYVIRMKQNFNYFLGMTAGFVAPTSGGAIKIDNGATLTVGTPYMIAIVGDGTATLWKAAGLPVGVTPAIGVCFIAATTTPSSANASTSRVIAAGTSTTFTQEVVGNTTLSNNTAAQTNGGLYVVVKVLNASGTPTNPAAGSVMGCQLRFDASSVTIDGL